MLLATSKIKPNPNNPRVIKDDAFKKLVKSIQEFPEMAEVREVVLNKDHVILGGNMRFRAMKEAGWAEIPVRIVDWTEDQQREFVIKDNVSGGEWDWEMLANEWDMEALEDWGLDLPDGFAHEDKEAEEDEAPELDTTTTTSEYGKIYQLGAHRLMCGDATKPEDVEKLMDGTKADMVFTDPPYGISYTGVAGSTKWNMIDNDDLRDQGLFQFIVDAFTNIHEHSKDNAGLYCWFSSKNNAEFTRGLNAANWDIKQELIWNKGMTLSGADYQYSHEPVLYCQKTRQKAKWSGGRDQKSILRQKRTDLTKLSKATLLNIFANMQKEATVWELDRDSVTTYQHPTQKPVTLGARAMNNSSDEGDLVLDLFAGSGSTLMAAEQTNRVCCTMELDPQYVDVIRKRYTKYITDGVVPDNWEELTPALE
jgi:DNA modification methylase